MSIDRAQPAGPAAQPLIRMDQVCLSRGGGEPLLKGVSFALAPGSFHLLTGAAGSGKSSLMRLMALADRPSGGLVQVFGRDAAALSPIETQAIRRRIGAALQPAVFLGHLSIWDNAALIPRMFGRRRRSYEAQVGEVLRWTGLADRASESPDALSIGERHRLAIARAALNGPEVLLIDEPAEGLDEAERRRAVKLVQGLARTGLACVIATGDDAAYGAGTARLSVRGGRLSVTETATA